MKNVKVEKKVWKELHRMKIEGEKDKISDVIAEMIENEREM